MYDSVCSYSEYIDKWFHRKAGALKLAEYIKLIDEVRKNQYPIIIKFGLEVCYFKAFEKFVSDIVKDKNLDFIVGSIHFIDDFAFDHKKEHWTGVDVDQMYQRFFETSIELAESCIYDGIAHPDSIKLFGHTPSYSLDEFYEKLTQALSENNVYMEQSSGIFRRCPDSAELGMNKDLLKCAKKHGVTIITVSDAHCPEEVGSYLTELATLIEQAY